MSLGTLYVSRMKRLIVAAALLMAPPLVLEIPEVPEIALEEVIQEQAGGLFFYSDEGFEKEEANFAPGQRVYLKIKTDAPDKAEAEITLLDENKAKLKTISVERRGQDFVGKFSAPPRQGVYYVHVEIKGEGFSFSAEQNINVSGNTSAVFGKSDSKEKSKDLKKQANNQDNAREQVAEKTPVVPNVIENFWAVVRQKLLTLFSRLFR